MAEGHQARKRRQVAAFFVVAAVIVAFDQLSKAHMRAHLPVTGGVAEGLPGVFRFDLVYNTGAAFSMGSGNQALFVVVAAVVCGAVGVYLARSEHLWTPVTISLALVVGGAVGNVIDRVAFGRVTDFVELTFMRFAVFNFADMCITCGCALFVILMLVSAVRQSGRPSRDAEADGEGRS